MHNTSRPSLTISVLTKNESANIERCLRSASFADELVVIDGGSDDNTVDLARACGAQVHVYPDWKGFAAQRTHQLTHATCDYLLLLDADEEITHQLEQEILSRLADQPKTVYGLYAREVAFGKELKYLAPHKTYNRLLRRDVVTGFEGAVHEKPIFRSEQTHGGFFARPVMHTSKPSIHVSLQKLTQYVALGAHKRRQMGKRGGVIRGLLAGAASFTLMYIVKRGFTGGAAGFLYCLFLALEAFFRYAAVHYDAPGQELYTKR
jgi:glycosyltransferase involved in cell wall biosynthesis